MTARGPVLVAVSVGLGILTGEAAGPAPARLRVLGALVLGAVAIVGVYRGRLRVALVCCCLAGGLGGSAVMARALHGLEGGPVADAVHRRADATVDITLTTDPEATRFTARALGRVGSRTVVVDASGDAAPRLGVARAGDRVRLRGYFRPLDEFERRARWEHAVGTFAADALVGYAPASSPLWHTANWLRDRVLAGTAGVPEPQRALLAGFLLGDTTDLPATVVDDFRRAGLSHLVAVSGQNVAFVLALAGPLLRRGHRGVRLLAGSAVVVVFAAMTRFEPSVLRASAMALAAMVALTAGRPTAGLRVLALAVIALLLIDPFLVHSVGFLLSCAASAGIALWSAAVARAVPGPRPFAEAVGVTVAAQLAVAPVLLVVFDGVPLVSVPANLLVAPVAGPLAALGLVGGVLGGVAGPGPVAAVVAFPAYVCASLVLLVARVAAVVPLTVGRVEVLLAAPGLVLAAGVFAMGRGRRATWRRARSRPPEPRLAVPPR